jgi:hypothetical protein
MTSIRLIVTVAALCACHLSSAAGSEKLERLQNPYQVKNVQACSSSGQSCSVAFPAITTSPTMIDKVSCLLVGTAVGLNQALFLVEDPTTNLAQALDTILQPFSFVTFNGITAIGINGDPHLVLQVGQIPQVEVAALGNTTLQNMSCTISRYY